MPKYLTEFVGTCFLVLIIGCSVHSAGNLAPLPIGIGLACLIYMGGPVSGGHFNPAVTLGALLCRKIDFKDAVRYWVVQVLGGIAGAFLACAIMRKSFAPAPAPTAPIIAILLAESAFTFMLVLVVLNTATVKKVAGNSYFGAAIGLTITVGAFSVGAVSGGAFNPAVGIGPTIAHAALDQGGFANLWYYLVGPLAGAVIAAGFFKIQHPGEKSEAA
ncbi:putative glycerol uptake facilitator protein [Phycisphaerales bacterium]|nr:putative glycerol uptake facilitator protein [Phycisphaerales bacterium]